MQISPKFSSVTPQTQTLRQPPMQAAINFAAKPAQPQVRFGAMEDFRIGRLAAALLAVVGLAGVGTGIVNYETPNNEIASVKDDNGVTKGYIEPGGEFQGEDVHGFVYAPDSKLGDDIRFPMFDLLDDQLAGVVVDGRAYDTNGTLVCTTDTTTVKQHEKGEPVGEEVGKYESVDGGTVFTNNAGDEQGTTTRKLQNENYEISADNQAAAACLLGTITQTPGKEKPAAEPETGTSDTVIENGKVVSKP